MPPRRRSTAPPRRRRITFEWAGEVFAVGEYAVPGPLWRVLQQAVCIVMDGGASGGAALAAAVPPGAPGAAFLADLVDEAAREAEWASGEEARGVVAELLGWMVANADEVMGQEVPGAGVRAGASGDGDEDGAGGHADGGGRAGSCGVRLIKSGHSVVQLQWRGRNFHSSEHVVLDAATAAACSDVVRITLRGREAAIVNGRQPGLNFLPDVRTPDDYITALLAAAPADDARWLAAGSGEPRHAEAFAAAHGAIAAYLAYIGHASAAAAAAVGKGERLQAGYAGIADVKGHCIVKLYWRGRHYMSSTLVVLDAATAAACADVARITLRGREAAIVNGNFPGLNYAPDGPAPNAYITALLAAAPADDARWLAAGSGEPRHAEAFAAAHAAIAAYLAHVGHASSAAAAALSKGERLQAGYAGIRDVKGRSVVEMAWRGRTYFSSRQVVLDAATAAACADVARITLRGREAAVVKGSLPGVNFSPDGPAPIDYITALLAAAPADDARWLAAGSGEPRHAAAFAAAHAAVAAYLEHLGHPAAAAASAVSKGERVQAGYAGIRDVKGRSIVQLQWRGRQYKSSAQVVLDAATAAACADVVRITLRGREAAIVKGRDRGLNFPPDVPTPNAYITALLAAAPADDARWLAAGSGEVRHAEAFAAAHGAIASYLEHVGHASAGEARARADDAAAGVQ
jgi:hypothetical protein